MNEKHILIVEDEEKVSALLSDYLKKDGFIPSVLSDGDLVIEQVKSTQPDMVLLDVMLPGKDGMTLCREIRQFSDVPIIMLTARVEEIDRLLGLELGADDYVCKPFSFREVVARVKANLRRVCKQDTPATLITSTHITLDVNTHLVMVEGQHIPLTPNEFELLKVMMSSPHKVFSRNELINLIQGYDFEGYERTIDTHIKNLRKKIAKMLPNQEVIGTVFKVGYKFSDDSSS